MTKKTRLKLFAGMAIAALGLSACASTPLQEITTPPVEPKVTSKAPVQKYVTLPARTFIYAENGKRAELAGIKCKLRGDKFHTSYQTPANVKLPVYGLETSALNLACRHQNKDVHETVGVRNLTSEQIAGSGAQHGLIGSLLASGIAAGRGNRPNDNYTYRTPYMALNEKPK
ncbi:hypothetical protein RA27_22040 [Ruegeria sp. ANG-R]|uniref:hypothetical protein n=1 Tax=Ruegeria sp. ANG-R TaxID=1577903 RepID=UPI00057DC3E3|nr:hypothetical protein [Ruegeria sp. ANG-R]KIC36439.1 hypothetical protein RA27_22040 [Ruegeria sp. ANG-R]